jgi:MFS family permease
MALCAAALAGLAVAHGSVAAVVGALAVVGVGVGCFTPTNNTAALRAAPRRNAAEVSGLLNMGRGLGTGVGLAVASLLVATTAGAAAASYGPALAAVAWVLSGVAAAGALLAVAASTAPPVNA